MVISQPPGDNPSYYYRASPTLPQLLWILGNTLCSIHAIATSRIAHENGAIKHIFYTNRIHGGSADYSLVLSLHALALHLAVKKYYFQIFLYEDLSTLALHTSVSCISQNTKAGTALCYATNTLNTKTFLIFDINHQQNTRRSDQIETISGDDWKLQKYYTEGLPMAQVAILKKYSIKCERFRL